MFGAQEVATGFQEELKRRLVPRWRPLPHQVPPPGDWYGWLMLGGRGSGKTDACTSYINQHALGPPCIAGPAPHWIGIIAPTLGDAVTSCYYGPSGIRAHNPHARLVNSPGGLVIRWPNGAEAKLFGAQGPEDIERLRAGGNRCCTMLEELAAWRYLDAAWDHMRFGLRIGPRPHWVAATTPKPRALIKRLDRREIPNVVMTRATINDNPHLPEQLRIDLTEEYRGTRLGAQELEGRLIDQDPNALWQRVHLEQGRIKEAPPLKKISVGVDPSGGAGEQGIVVVGRRDEEHLHDGRMIRRPYGYVLADETVHTTPSAWGRAAVEAAIVHQADDICVEVNFGGDMAVSVIRGAADSMGIGIPVRPVRASRGKRVRAEPVAALAEPGRRQWHHVGVFPELEDQLCTWTIDMDWSPDRLDAMVWPAWHMKIVSVARQASRGKYAGQQAATTVVG